MFNDRFQEAWQEAENHQLSYAELQETLRPWTEDVQGLFEEITDAEIPPIDLRPAYDQIVRLTGWLVDITLMLQTPDNPDTRWMIRTLVRRYQQDCTLHQGNEGQYPWQALSIRICMKD